MVACSRASREAEKIRYYRDVIGSCMISLGIEDSNASMHVPRDRLSESHAEPTIT